MANAAVAAIQFALKTDEGLEFLRYWNYGEFDVIRREWPDAPEEVYIGADPLYQHWDVHIKTAAEMFGVEPSQVTQAQRNAAKQRNYLTLYKNEEKIQ